jgi:5-methylcytosine-specific restriction endonuclease McrA
LYFIVKRGRILNVNIVSKEGNICKVNHNGTIYMVKSDNVFDNIEHAKFKNREIYIKTKYKKKHKDKNGFYTCVCCGNISNNITLDHIKSLHSLGGEKEIRNNHKLWEIAWSENNFQLMCEDCNRKKNISSQNEFNNLMRKLNKRGKELGYKKTILLSKGVKDGNKCSFGINKNEYLHEIYIENKRFNINSTDIDVQIAKMDSRIIPLDIILC